LARSLRKKYPPRLLQGSVVYPKEPVPDPQGRNPKRNRPFVVITSDEDIRAGADIVAVGITTELSESEADHYVLLEYGRNARTGLKEKSGALCSWVITRDRDDLEIVNGFVAPTYVLEIVKKIIALNSEGERGVN